MDCSPLDCDSRFTADADWYSPASDHLSTSPMSLPLMKLRRVAICPLKCQDSATPLSSRLCRSFAPLSARLANSEHAYHALAHHEMAPLFGRAICKYLAIRTRGRLEKLVIFIRHEKSIQIPDDPLDRCKAPKYSGSVQRFHCFDSPLIRFRLIQIRWYLLGMQYREENIVCARRTEEKRARFCEVWDAE